mgnify:CR=1 FL=1
MWILLALCSLGRLALLLRGTSVSGDEAAHRRERSPDPPTASSRSTTQRSVLMGTAGDVSPRGLALRRARHRALDLELVNLLLAHRLGRARRPPHLGRLVLAPRPRGALAGAVPPDFVSGGRRKRGRTITCRWCSDSSPAPCLTCAGRSRAPVAARRLAVLGYSPASATDELSLDRLCRRSSCAGRFGRYTAPRSIGEVVLPPLAFAIGALPHLLYTAQAVLPAALRR